MTSRKFWENFIFVAIVLVIVQMFFDELSRYLHWPIATRNFLLFAGLFFDITFSAEFAARTILAKKQGSAPHYWLYERGWVDFLSSFPLLLLDSGPSVYLLLSGHIHEAGATIGVLNILKVVKAIRITRILRLVRIIKIFGKIHNVDSKMALHHTASISTTAVFSIIFTLMIFSFVAGNPIDDMISRRRARYTAELNKIFDIHQTTGIASEELAQKFFVADESILRVLSGERVLYSSITEDTFTNYYTNDDYLSVAGKDLTVQVSLVDIHRYASLEHIRNFFIIIFTVIAFMLFYTRHFVQTISDLIHIMNKGFRKRDYNLQIKIRDEFKDEEIFKLARFYNDAFLPAKSKRVQQQEEKKSSGLSMKDLTDFNQ